MDKLLTKQTQMKIRQKSSGRVLENFPNYDTCNGVHGYFVVTFDYKVLFFSGCDGVECDDVTKDFEIILVS